MTPAEEESAVRTFFALDAIASPADLAPSLLPWVLGVLVVVAVTVALVHWEKKKAEARRRENQGLERRPRDDKEEKP